MAQSVEEFLTLLKLDDYVPNFERNDIKTLLTVDDTLLQYIGIDKIGHRKRILTELEKLRNASATNLSDEETVVIDIDLEKTGDDPPPLPPKNKVNLVPQPTNQNGPSRSDSMFNKQKPVKPPRDKKFARSTLPHNFKSSGTAYDSKTTPEIPPRSDLLDRETMEENVGSACIDENLHSCVASTHDDTNVVEHIEPASPIEKPKPIKPERPPRTSVKRPAPIAPKREPVQADISKNEQPSPTRRMTRGEHLPRRQFTTSPDNEDIPSISVPPTVEKIIHNEQGNSENDGSNDSEDLPNQPTNGDKNEPTNGDKDEPTNGDKDEDTNGDKDAPTNGDKDEDTTLTLSMIKDPKYFFDLMKSHGSQNEKKGDRKSRFLQPGKSGYLSKRGGQKGDKSVQKRWIEFDGTQLKYFKEKGCEPKQIIPVSRMMDVEVEQGVKKPTFHLVTPNRRFTFIEPFGKQDELTIWVSILMEAILNKDENVACTIGGKMADPHKEGWLLKQGHNVLHDFKNRYVAIKDDQLCYYYTFEDFKDDLPINCLEMSLVSLKEDLDKQRLLLHTNREKTFVFDAGDLKSHISWKSAIERAIQVGLGNSEYLKIIQMNESNRRCADCGDKDPIYASVNLLVVVCAQCIGCHRYLGTSVSKTKSILMDVKVWTPSLIELFQKIGNANANTLWTFKMPSDDKIQPDAERELRQNFITGKYKDKRYFQWSEKFGQPEELGKALRETVTTVRLLETLQLIISGADVYYVPDDSEDEKTPYELARDAGMNLQMELLTIYQGHLTEEEKEQLSKTKEPDGFVNISSDDLVKELNELPKLPDTSAPNYEKSGVLLIRNARNETWKEKLFTLHGRKLEYRKGAKPDDCELIDLSQLEEIEYGREDNLCISLKVAGRYHFLKAYIPEDSDAWYNVIRNKQVMGVAIENQECNDKQIPYLIESCIGFIERNALLMEGIYRLNGSQLVIKKLIMLFNQDAPRIRLSFEDYPDVHAVAGLLKQYLRELPDPLLTNEVNDETAHSEKLYTYRDLLTSLPKINFLVLRCLILHLNQVIKVADRNKMKLQNIIVIFGPILLSCGNTTDQAWLNREYTVLSDLLMYHEWLFDVSPSEVSASEAMIDILIKQTAVEKSQPSGVINSMQIPIHVGDNEDQMKMTNATMPSDVCLFCIQKHNLPVDSNWALFEVMTSGNYERPVYSKEPVLPLAMTIGGGGKLVVKENYVAEMLSPFQSSNLGVMGYLHYAKDKDKWKKNLFVEVKTGNIKVYSKKGSTKEEDNIAIHEILLYVGVDPKKKPPEKSRFGFVLKTSEGFMRYFCSENEVEINMFIAAILSIRYPTGVWTPIHAENKNSSAGICLATPDPHWGRQSTYVRASGTSSRLMDQLQYSRRSLKKNILRK